MIDAVGVPSDRAGRGGAAVDLTDVGRAHERAALVAAAVHEMAVQGIDGASIRTVAARAGVERSQALQHFGSKEGLVGAVRNTLADEVATAFGRDGLAGLTGPAASRYARVLARAVLDGYDVSALQTTHPVIERVLPLAIERSDLDPSEVKVRLAQQMALQLGWLLLEPFVSAAVGLDDDERARARHDSAPSTRMFDADATR